jgi:hypothetical protein
MLDNSLLDHSIVHRDLHAGGVRIIPNEDLDVAVTEMRLLFPHAMVLMTPMGCCHACVYIADAPASLVAERISEHLRDVEHRSAF